MCREWQATDESNWLNYQINVGELLIILSYPNDVAIVTLTKHLVAQFTTFIYLIQISYDTM